MMQGSRMKRVVKTFQINSEQLRFGSYAAELSFYIIWAIVPIMLALANVISVLPIDQQAIISVMEAALPDEVEVTLIPILEGYLTSTSTGIFSLSLIISLWPASNVFNTIQRVFNLIYKAPPRPNFILARLFAYVFTLAIVFAFVAGTFVNVFGEIVLNFIDSILDMPVTTNLFGLIFQQKWLIWGLAIFGVLLLIYHFIPNVQWHIKYALPGTIFALIGFIVVSQLFTVYTAIAGDSISNNTIGVFIILIIWLYFNMIVLSLGAYLNVLVHDYYEKPYWQLVEESRSYSTYQAMSKDYDQSYQGDYALRDQIKKEV
ncbi:hypothetical protein CL176_06315 [Suicoccus acidiformans]|uniref:Uncharacterized protein n=1 Tax=Suicoccus acidiformans TaxID=2036206 RepID=A0A347WKN4_9LACT|nr:YihY/virulence factor BrkB family protein [Suicoccus acidiformans]AXY25641.1 hypothetical protein CL176_06315 [Suicoccus acidiformans]